MTPTLTFARKRLIGVVHLKPLPGSPRFADTLDEILKPAVADARAYERGGADAIFIENFGDVPFTKGPVGNETVAAMAVIGRAIRSEVRLPIGFNVLRNDARAALALCAACGGSFIRVNVHCGAMLTDQGLIEGNAYETLRYRRQICATAQILADVHVKHAVRLGDPSIEQTGRDTIERGLADGLIVSGTGTGMAASIEQLQRLRRALPKARILVGSGITRENAADYLSLADGLIVGTSLKRDAGVERPVDRGRVERLSQIVCRS